MNEKMKLTPTTEEQIELCNSINTAIGRGYEVRVNNRPIEGTIMKDGSIMTVIGGYHPCRFNWSERVVITKISATEVKTLYEPIPPRIHNKTDDVMDDSNPPKE